MSFLNRMMASIGIGSAKVDTELQSARIRAGEELSGVVLVRGGNLTQQVENIYLHLLTQYWKESNNEGGKNRHTVTLDRFHVTAPFTLEPGETREFPFRFPLPDGTPVTVGRTPVWLKTGLEIAMAVDPTDKDRLEILPHRHAQVLLDAIEQLGFRLRKAECEYSRRLGREWPFIQEFEFVPTSQFRRKVDELEVVLFPHADGVEAILEVDRRARGLAGLFEEAFEADESRLRVEFGREHLATGVGGMAQYLADILNRYAR